MTAVRPAFVAAIEGRDVDELAAAAHVSVEVMHQIIAGDRPATVSQRDRLARLLGGNADDLFRLEPDHDQALPVGPARFVTDPAALRVIDQSHRPAA
jgi:plasmid maintenance system antidote protein VapI